MNLKYNEIRPDQLEEASALILRTFLEYNADDLSQESIDTFKEITSAEYLKEWLDWKEKLPKFFNMWVCVDDDTDKIVGVAVGYFDKIDSLFVAREYHHNGIAKQLFAMFLEYFNPAQVRVFSSFYAQDFYRKLGFAGDEEQIINKGQRVIFMTYQHEGGVVSDYVGLTEIMKNLTEKYGEEKANAIIAEASATAIPGKTDLTKIPGIGVKMARHLINAGYPFISTLKGQNPDEIYHQDCLYQGVQVDRCALYCYRLAVHYADNDGQLPPDKQKWWNWKD